MKKINRYNAVRIYYEWSADEVADELNRLRKENGYLRKKLNQSQSKLVKYRKQSNKLLNGYEDLLNQFLNAAKKHLADPDDPYYAAKYSILLDVVYGFNSYNSYVFNKVDVVVNDWKKL